MEKDIQKINNIMEETMQRIITTTEENEQNTNKIFVVIKDLIKQRDNAESSTLSALLDKEITAYMNVISAFGKYGDIFSRNLKKFTNKRKKLFDDFMVYTNKMRDQMGGTGILDSTENLCNLLILRNTKLFIPEYSSMAGLLSVYCCEFAIISKLYNSATSRNFKDWNIFITKLLGIFADLVTENAPVYSTLKSLYDRCKNIKELIEEYEKNGTDYSNEDKKLKEIEVHIEIMESAVSFFSQIIENIKSESDDIFADNNFSNTDEA